MHAMSEISMVSYGLFYFRHKKSTKMYAKTAKNTKCKSKSFNSKKFMVYDSYIVLQIVAHIMCVLSCWKAKLRS